MVEVIKQIINMNIITDKGKAGHSANKGQMKEST